MLEMRSLLIQSTNSGKKQIPLPVVDRWRCAVRDTLVGLRGVPLALISWIYSGRNGWRQ